MKTKLPKQPSNLEAELLAKMKYVGFPEFETEYQFDSARRWRFDFAFPQSHFRIAVEAEGGVWSGGRHVRGQGFIDDCEKYNRAAIDGWCVLRFTAESIKDNSALDQIEESLRRRGWKPK
jgi:very-short-patch-repair endonuclease